MTTADTPADRLAEGLKSAEAMLAQLQVLLPELDSLGPTTGTVGRHAPESDEPWNNVVADAYWGIWHGAGKLVGLLRYAVGLKQLPEREAPTGPDALKAIGNLAPAAPDDVLRDAVRVVEGWIDKARRIPAIDESEAWSPIGPQPPECPYCRTFSLRMQRRRGVVRCMFPGCRDSDGNPTRARMEPGRMSGEESLVFDDGLMLRPAA